MLAKLLALLLWATKHVYAGCGQNDFETMIGGYEDVHEVSSIVFDVNPDTLDMVVAGTNRLWNDKYGFIYFV